MTAQNSLDRGAGAETGAAARPATRPTRRVRRAGSSSSPGRFQRYRLEVMAATAADIVSSAGGWLLDRVLAGWEIDVLLAEAGDGRPLAILGLTPRDLDAAYLGPRREPDALAVSTELLARDFRARDRVVTALGRGDTEVALWGEVSPLELETELSPVVHVLSSAARVFKSHALLASGVGPEDAPAHESFRRGAVATMADDLAACPAPRAILAGVGAAEKTRRSAPGVAVR